MSAFEPAAASYRALVGAKITRLHVERRLLKHDAVGNVVQAWEARAALLVRLSLSLGDGRVVVGLGEASPLPGAAYDTPDLAAMALGAVELPVDLGALLARGSGDPPAGETAFGALDADAHVLDVILPSTAASPSARFAVETALLDAAARALHVPLEVLIGAEAPLSFAALADSAEDAAAKLAAGARAIKLKVGGGVEADAMRVREVRRAVGDAVPLRLDANRAFSPADAIAFAGRVAPERIEFFEEPTEDITAVAPEGWAVPIALDETLQSPFGARHAEMLSAAGKLGALVIKPAVVGGVRLAAAWAVRAHELGAPAVFTHTFGGPVELGVTLALASRFAPDARGTAAAQGLSPHAALPAWPALDARGYGPEGFDPAARRDGAAGLGAFAAWASN